MSESYGSAKDPEEDDEIPFCTLKMFPEDAVRLLPRLLHLLLILPPLADPHGMALCSCVALHKLLENFQELAL